MTLIRRGQPMSKDHLEQLYLRERLWMAEIAGKLGCSVNKVVYWMDRHQIPRRRQDEASYVKHNPTGDPFDIKELQTEGDRELFQLGIGLYIGEGTKARGKVVLANTDSKVICAFLRFLREICQVEEKRIYAYLNVFDDVDLEEALDYWAQVTELPRSQFVKPTVRSSKGGSYNNKSRYGTLTVGVSNTKLSDRVNAWCKEALARFGK
jgi:hypothetical protein